LEAAPVGKAVGSVENPCTPGWGLWKNTSRLWYGFLSFDVLTVQVTEASHEQVKKTLVPLFHIFLELINDKLIQHVIFGS
jgi:hypothetical protein